MNIDAIVLSIATLIGLYMAANIGANDLANAMRTAVGSRALPLKQAVIVSIIANVLGASLAGGYVTGTISRGIIDPIFLMDAPNNLMLGMFAALIAAGLWVPSGYILGSACFHHTRHCGRSSRLWDYQCGWKRCQLGQDHRYCHQLGHFAGCRP